MIIEHFTSNYEKNKMGFHSVTCITITIGNYLTINIGNIK